MLVGYGPRTTTAARRPRKGATPAGASAATAQQAVQTSMMTSPTPVQEPPVDEAPESAPAHTVHGSANGAGVRVLAKPPVRKLAKDLGVDLATITPTGDGGVVTRSDYDALGRRTRVTQADSRPAGVPLSGGPVVTVTAYDRNDHVVGVTDPNGNVTTYDYDDLGRMVAKVEALKTPDERTTLMAYDQADNLISLTTGLSADADYRH